jgi:hypothetical protein
MCDKYGTDPKWQSPEPIMLITANSYKVKTVEPFIRKLKGAVRNIVTQYFHLKGTVNDLKIACSAPMPTTRD